MSGVFSLTVISLSGLLINREDLRSDTEVKVVGPG